MFSRQLLLHGLVLYSEVALQSKCSGSFPVIKNVLVSSVLASRKQEHCHKVSLPTQHPCIVFRSGLWNPGRVYDLFGEMLAALNTFSLLFCVFLNVKVSFATSAAKLPAPALSIGHAS